MTTVSKELLFKQWQTLHNNHENYEQYALIIKLAACITTLAAFAFSVTNCAAIALLAVLWLQEGIWKTFQSRTANAIIAIEKRLSTQACEQENEGNTPYLLYQDWQENRSSALTLIKEYIGNSLKPTVIYPYAPLIIVLLLF